MSITTSTLNMNLSRDRISANRDIIERGRINRLLKIEVDISHIFSDSFDLVIINLHINALRDLVHNSDDIIDSDFIIQLDIPMEFTKYVDDIIDILDLISRKKKLQHNCGLSFDRFHDHSSRVNRQTATNHDRKYTDEVICEFC